MDPFMHLLLPVLFLLAIRVDARKTVMFAPLAVLPDFDVLFGLHRAVFHSFIPMLVIPLMFIIYSKMRRPDWMLGALLAQFFLGSHLVLDLGGVSFLWPFTTDQFYFEPELTVNFSGGVNFVFHLHYGLRPFQSALTTDFLSETGFAALFLGVLLGVVFRREAMAALGRLWSYLSGMFAYVTKR